MTEENKKLEQKNTDKVPPARKKTYQKPGFKYERVFETMALACGKVSPTQFQCRFNRKNS